MELYRLLQQQGLGSRKACRQLIEQGRVIVNGACLQDPRSAVEPQHIHSLVIDDEAWLLHLGHLYLLLHKPAGYECSHQPQHHRSVYSLLPYPFINRHIAALGRLDVDTTGLLLLSTDGQFIHALSSPKKHVPKGYQVTLKHPVSTDLLQQLSQGVMLRDEGKIFAAEQLDTLNSQQILLTISEGKYHQVKRMVAAAGNRVEQLHRVSLGSLSLGELPLGEWRHLSETELVGLGITKTSRMLSADEAD